MENNKNVVNYITEIGADTPPGINMPTMVNSAHTVTKSVGGSGITFNFSWIKDSHNITNINKVSGAGRAAGDGLAWFGTHFKEIAIVAAGAALIAGIAKLIKSLEKSIKVRYNRCVKTLQKAQLDFVTNPAGLDMKAVMPGVGSRIADWAARVWTMNFGKKRFENTKKYNIGLYPFCDRYIEEIGKDYSCAVQAFNKIALTQDPEATKAPEEEKSEGGEQKTESVVPVYSSFREAYSSDALLEGEQLNEFVTLGAISAGIGLASFIVRGGQFVFSKIKNGKPEEGTEKNVQVTKESVREICYAIIYNYMDKYVNMEQVFKQIGINTNSLADLDMSSVEKLKGILEKYSKPEKNVYTKQYGRLFEAYKNMLDHYYKIGDGIITNFSKYTEANDEKHSNLLVASKEKLQNMWDAQKDMFNNNFSHVLIEIISSPVYIGYLNFIIENVLPVFKTGLAGDADYVLDVMPSKDQYYLLRQTASQAWLGKDEQNKGNYAIAKVNSFDEKTKEIKFKLICLYGGGFDVSDNGIVTIDDYYKQEYDYDAFKDKGEVTLPYGKWLALDPALMDWSENVTSHIYYRLIDDKGKVVSEIGKASAKQYVYFMNKLSDIRKEQTERNLNTFSTAVVGMYDIKKKGYANVYDVKLGKAFTEDEIREIMAAKNDEQSKNMQFVDTGTSSMDDWCYLMKDAKHEEKSVQNGEEFVEICNAVESEIGEKVTSILYSRDISSENGKEFTEYAFAKVSGDLESVMAGDYQRLNDNTVNEEGEGEGEGGEDKKEGGDGTDTVIKPDDKRATENLVTGLYIACIKKGTDLANKEESEFSGSFVKLKTPCSIKDVDENLRKINFKGGVDDPSKKREDIFSNIMSNKGTREAQLSGEFEITNIEEAIKQIRERKNAAENLVEHAGEIAQKVFDAVNGLGLQNSDYGSGPLMNSNGVKFVRNNDKFSFFRAVNNKVNKMGYVEVDTGLKTDNGEDIKIMVYPILLTNAPVETKEVPADAKPGVVLAFEEGKETYMRSGELDVEKLKGETVPTLLDEYINRKHMEDPRFKFSIKDEPDNTITYEVLKKVENLINTNVKLQEEGDVVKYAVVNEVNQDNIKIANISGSTGVQVVIKLDEKNTVTFNMFAEKTKNGGTNTKFTTYDNKLAYQSDQFKLGGDIKETLKRVLAVAMGKEKPIENTPQNKEQQGQNNQQGQNAGTAQQNPQSAQTNQGGSQPAAQSGENTAGAPQQGQQTENSSVKISYSVKDTVNENNSTKVTVERKLNKEIKGWYIVSETAYDDGSMGRTLLESASFRKAMKTRVDVMKFVKSNSDAVLKEAVKSQTYDVYSNMGYKPSVATPLYESVMLVKFDSDNNIEKKEYLGKNKVK